MGKLKVTSEIRDIFHNILCEIVKKQNYFTKENVIIKYNELYANDDFKKFRLNYPKINFTISKDEILVIEKFQNLLLQNHNNLSDLNVVEKPTGTIDSEIVLVTPLEKLLFSIIWKNGQLNRAKSIVEGLIESNLKNKNKKDDDDEYNPNNGIVFRQFGRFLSNPKSPIIDQHVIRFFYLIKNYKSNTNVNELEYQVQKNKNKPDFKKIKIKDIGTQSNPINEFHRNEYISFINEIKLDNETRYKLDCIFFTLGKVYKNL